MIGNEVEFSYMDKNTFEDKEAIGLVVDAYTNVSGYVKGKGESLLGFGYSKTIGETESKRIYRIQYFSFWDDKKEYPKIIEIPAWRVKKILTFAKIYTTEEKIVSENSSLNIYK